jgi:hypothetical protein
MPSDTATTQRPWRSYMFFTSGQKLLQHKGAFGQVNQVRAVVGKLLAQGRGGGQKAGVAPHHHPHVDAGQRGVVQVGTGKGLRDKARRRRKARRVVVAHQIVVNGFGDVHAAQG